MTRLQLISEIMAQARAVTDYSDAALCCYIEQKLSRVPFSVLREIYSTHAIQRLVIGARAKKSLLASPLNPIVPGAGHSAQSEGAK